MSGEAGHERRRHKDDHDLNALTKPKVINFNDTVIMTLNRVLYTLRLNVGVE